MMIAIDWSHTKGLTTYDGKKVRVETKKTLLARIRKAGDGEESNSMIQSTDKFNSPSLVLEQGCPMSLIYDLVTHGGKVFLIDNKATQRHREEHGIEKTDENDAKIIYELASNGTKLTEVLANDTTLQFHNLYHQYCRFQKARVAMENMKKSHLRQYETGGRESTLVVQSMKAINLSPDLTAYDIATDTLEAKERSLLKKLEELLRKDLFNLGNTQPPDIKGLGKRIWAGLMVTANPRNFRNLSAYLRFCGLTGDVIKSHKYNRHAKMLYHMLAEEVMKLKDPEFRSIYDRCKEDIAKRHPDYKKIHIHNGALNRTATYLAKRIYAYCSDDETHFSQEENPAESP